MFENTYSILDLLGWLFVGVAIGACVLFFALWLYVVRRASGLTKRAADECPCSSDGKHEFYQGSTWRICAHCGTRR